eukprot:3212447-Rhodomonas_salina.1
MCIRDRTYPPPHPPPPCASCTRVSAHAHTVCSFCFYSWDVAGRYYPASVVLNFFAAHNQSITHFPIFVVDPK